jgi:hypothetical protein
MRLSTIGFLVTFGIGFLWTPLVATSPQPGKVYRIGSLSAFSPTAHLRAAARHPLAGPRHGLRSPAPAARLYVVGLLGAWL